MATGSQRKRRGEKKDNESRSGELLEKVVKIKRCSAVVKGGRRFSFAAMVVIGDGKGKVGWGYGKANEVPPSVEKAVKEGMRSMVEIPLDEGTIPHTVKGTFGAVSSDFGSRHLGYRCDCWRCCPCCLRSGRNSRYSDQELWLE